MYSKTKTTVSLIMNCIIALVTTGIVISYFFFPGAAIHSGVESFRFFTTDSNILAAIGAAVTAVFDIRMLRGKTTEIPKWAVILKFTGVIGLMLTFTTVMCLLIPLYGVPMMLGGTAFHMHLTAPALSFVSFVFFEKSRRITLPETPLGLIPIVIYGAVYFTQVIVLKNWTDFYGFNMGGKWYIVMPVIFALSYGMCMLVKALKNKAAHD